MFSPALRNSLRRVSKPQRTSSSVSYTRRACLSTGVRIPKYSARSLWLPVVVGTLTVSAVLLFNSTVRLDTAEGTKSKRKANPKQKQSQEEQTASESDASAKTKELRVKEEEESGAENVILEPASEGETTEGNGDAGGGGAFNPETGEINWDCPCLGGMAHGPCGQEFRDAFSCFVFSEEEPKGINCVEKFKGMQDCFRRHPEVYGEEIMSDDEDDEDNEGASSPSGTDSPPLKGGTIPDPDSITVPSPGVASSSQ